MKYRVLKTFLHDRLGKCVKGSIVELTSLSGVAAFVEPVEGSKPAPLSDAAASPAAQASPQKTSKPSKRGGRKPKTES